MQHNSRAFVAGIKRATDGGSLPEIAQYSPYHLNIILLLPKDPTFIFIPKSVFYGELEEGKRSQGGQKKRYKDILKVSLKDFDIPMRSWEQTSLEPSKWRGLINKGAAHCEGMRICEADRKRRERKAKTNGPPADSMPLNLLYICTRQVRARIA